MTSSNGRAFHAPGGPGVRMDSALYAGYTVPPYYDSLIAKLIVHDVDRRTAIRRLERCLEEVVIDGIPSTVPLLRAIFATDDVRESHDELPAGAAKSFERRQRLVVNAAVVRDRAVVVGG